MKHSPSVGLFVTCLVDLFRPQIAFACIKLLEKVGCKIIVPLQQTCCGQPAYNNGDRFHTQQIAKNVITLFETVDYVVVPSGSCAGMFCKHYPTLFQNDEVMQNKANQFAKKTFEITSFLVDVLKIKSVDAHFNKTITYHDACSGLRELNIKSQPRELLSSVEGLRLIELKDVEECCGFGGTFCVKYSSISNKMVSDKCACIQKTDADVLLSGDLGCLLNIAGKLKRQKARQQVFHIIEVLADMAESSAIGETNG